MQKPMKHGHLSRGAAVIDGNFAYFTPYDSNCIYRYNIINGEWLDLPDCVCSNAALAIIDGTVVTIGGEYQGDVTNKLYILQHNNNCWIEDSQYPSMNTPRSHCAVVSIQDYEYRDHVIVIGGKTHGGNQTNRIDFLEKQSRCWYIQPLCHTPFLLPLQPNVVICYMLLIVWQRVTHVPFSTFLTTPTSHSHSLVH